MATTRRLTDQQIKQIQESTEPVRIVAAELGISKTAVHYYRNQRDGTRRRLTDQQVEIIEASTKPVRIDQEDIETVELWIDTWEDEITSDDETDREMYEEDRKVILAVRRLVAHCKADKGGGE